MSRKSVKIYRKCISISDKLLVKYRKRRIFNTDFSIICNNCWGGYVYRRYKLPYLSPTVGLYFFAVDFVEFCYDLKYYLNEELEFISWKDSKWSIQLKERNHTQIPIARLGDIEVVFLHYQSKEEAEEKWKRRAARINYDNLIYKFSMMNECSEREIQLFNSLQVAKKFCFVPKRANLQLESTVKFNSEESDSISDDTSEYSRYINLEKLINAKYVCGLNMK